MKLRFWREVLCLILLFLDQREVVFGKSRPGQTQSRKTDLDVSSQMILFIQENEHAVEQCALVLTSIRVDRQYQFHWSCDSNITIPLRPLDEESSPLSKGMWWWQVSSLYVLKMKQFSKNECDRVYILDHRFVTRFRKKSVSGATSPLLIKQL